MRHRCPKRSLAGLVFIGGGADTSLILADTTLGNDDLRLTILGRGLPSPAKNTFIDAFRTHATRDDREIWDWLDQHPSVVLEAGFDRAIPYQARRELKKRLPGATSWWYPLGHYGLFVLLSRESDAIVDWIETTLAERRSDGIRQLPAGSGRIRGQTP